MPASEAARSFTAVPDAAEHGETIVVTRGGQRVALFVPAPRANGAALREIFERWSGNSALDARFADHVAGVRDAVSGELDTDPWRD